MFIIERLGNGFKVRAKEIGMGPNQPNATAKTIREACEAAEHYFGGTKRHGGKRKSCPFCRQQAARAKKASK